MSKERQLPEDPLGFIQRCVRQRKILWTYHVNMRLTARFIPREAILESVAGFDLIERYPEDKYLPSYLVWTKHRGETFHVLFAADVSNDQVRIITAYRPDPDEWDQDRRNRRNPT